MLEDQPHDRVHLLRGRLARRPFRTRLDPHVADALVVRDGRERGQLAVLRAVDLEVRERDEALVAAAVVPAQRARPDQRISDVQDGREPRRQDLARPIECRGLLFVLQVERGLGREEDRRRELEVVAGHHGALAAEDGGDGVRGQDLAGLVEDHEVEVGPVRGEDLAHEERAHRPAGLHGGQDVRGGREQVPDRQVADLPLGLARETSRSCSGKASRAATARSAQARLTRAALMVT